MNIKENNIKIHSSILLHYKTASNIENLRTLGRL